MNKQILLYYLSTCFHSFFGRQRRHQKRHFENNWPLVQTQNAKSVIPFVYMVVSKVACLCNLFYFIQTKKSEFYIFFKVLWDQWGCPDLKQFVWIDSFFIKWFIDNWWKYPFLKWLKEGTKCNLPSAYHRLHFSSFFTYFQTRVFLLVISDSWQIYETFGFFLVLMDK